VRLDAGTRALLAGPNYAHVSTLMRDGSPHSVPVWIDVEGEHPVLVKELDSVGMRNLRRDPRLALSITCATDPFCMTLIRGRAAEVREDHAAAQERVRRLALLYIGRPYPGEMPADLVTVVVAPERVSYRRLPGFSPRPAAA
jgi:PPOX class probable F420-dependent enzyme